MTTELSPGRNRIAGVLPVIQTPFDDDYDIDYGDLDNEVDWLFDNGADGAVIGMVSEVLRLASEERDELAARLCKSVRGRGPVVVSATAESTHGAIRHAQVAEGEGAAAVMCTLPVTVAVLEAQALAHFDAIVSATTLPVIVQDASGYVGHEMSVGLMARLETLFGDRVMFKPETPPLGQRVSELRALTGQRSRVFEGSGGIALVEAFRRGVVGTMPGADLCWAVAALWGALESEDDATVRRLQGPLVSLVALQGQLDSFVAIEKHLLRAQGVIGSSRVRGPAGYVPDPVTLQEADRLIAQLRDAVDGVDVPTPMA